MRDVRLVDGAITVSPLRLEDLDVHLAGEDEQLVRWLNGRPSTREGTEAYLRRCQEEWETEGPHRAFGIRAGTAKVLAGTIDLRFDGEGLTSGQVALAYGLYPNWRGRGLATRAVNLVCRYAGEHGAMEAVIRVEPDNQISVRVAQRAGFTYVRRVRDSDSISLDQYQRDLRIHGGRPAHHGVPASQ
jgi:RimJ/RimL family protein N-acetyltransferase